MSARRLKSCGRSGAGSPCSVRRNSPSAGGPRAALHLSAVLADYAHSMGVGWLRREALAGLELSLT